jgi:hypothetical protein
MNNRSFRHLTHVLLFVAALAATALGCVWVGTPDSVRFNDHLDYNEMGRLPPLPAETNESEKKNDKLVAERNRLLDYLKRNNLTDDVWFNPDNPDLKTSAGTDKLDALTALKQGSPFANVEAYMTARTLQDQDRPAEEVEQALAPAASDINLKDNIAYLRAAKHKVERVFLGWLKAVEAFVRRYPLSGKRL